MTREYLSTREVAEIIGRPIWRVRRVVDALSTVPRIGTARMIPAAMVETIRDEVARIERREAVES